MDYDTELQLRKIRLLQKRTHILKESLSKSLDSLNYVTNINYDFHFISTIHKNKAVSLKCFHLIMPSVLKIYKIQISLMKM